MQNEQEEIIAKTVLIPTERYLKTGAHIGTRFKSGDMKPYIYKQRSDGLKVLDIQITDQRIAAAAKMIAELPADRIMVVSRKLYGQTPAKKFADAIGAKSIVGRFIPGTFTNSNNKRFVEPKIVVVSEPDSDGQAVNEAAAVKATVIALCSTNNSTKHVNLVIPINNKGRKSLALVYWLLAREVLKARGTISKDDDFKENVEDFEYKLTEADIQEEEAGRRLKGKGGRFGHRPFRSFGGRTDRFSSYSNPRGDSTNPTTPSSTTSSLSSSAAASQTAPAVEKKASDQKSET